VREGEGWLVYERVPRGVGVMEGSQRCAAREWNVGRGRDVGQGLALVYLNRTEDPTSTPLPHPGPQSCRIRACPALAKQETWTTNMAIHGPKTKNNL